MSTSDLLSHQHCPRNCGSVLERDPQGRIMCPNPACDHPTLADEVLTAGGHIVEIAEGEFWVMHPPRRCVVDGAVTCDLNEVIQKKAEQVGEPPLPIGHYLANPAVPEEGEKSRWLFHAAPDAAPINGLADDGGGPR